MISDLDLVEISPNAEPSGVQGDGLQEICLRAEET